MATYDNAYSRLVAWLKIALPLMALAILSTLFLFSRTLDPEQAIPYADVDVDQAVREQRLSRPAFSGVTRDGSAISLSADAVRPEEGETSRLRAEGVNARVEMPTGALARLAAPLAMIDDAAETADLSGGVAVDTSTGYRIDGEAFTSRLDRTEITSAGAVVAVGPAGRINAGGMRLTQDGRDGYVLVFNEGVTLIYDPRRPLEQQ